MSSLEISTDPDFGVKLVDVVGLYLDPPARAVVFSFDETTQCQALDRTQPSLPMKRVRLIRDHARDTVGSIAHAWPGYLSSPVVDVPLLAADRALRITGFCEPSRSTVISCIPCVAQLVRSRGPVTGQSVGSR